MSAEIKPQFDKPEDLIWDTYLKAAKGEDEVRPKNWEGSTTGILTFTGLFAATVAAFIIESYKRLSSDSGDRTNLLLEHLIVAMANVSSHQAVAPPPPDAFSVPPTAVVTNAFWFSSLLIALICALLSTLVQEWSRNYVHDISTRQVLHENLRARAFNHMYIRMGVNRYGMDQFVSWIVALVHLSVFLFACGLLVFLFPINHIVTCIAGGVLAMFIVIYLIASLLPLIDAACPYRTPVSYMMAFIYWVALRGLSACVRLWPRNEDAKNKNDLFRLFERQYTGFHWEFMTDPRFVFAWDHTYLHIADESLETFFKALPSVISRPSIWSRLCSDLVFMRRVWLYLDGRHRAMRTDAPSLVIETEIFELVTCLSDRMYALEVEQYGKRIEDTAYTSAYCLDVLGIVSQLTEVDGLSQLSARLCLTHARWSLLKRCQEASKKKMPVISPRGAPDFSREASRTGFRLERHSPCGILLLLIAGSYKSGTWEHRSTSCLMPLHEDDCCRSWSNVLTPEGLAHVAASNALSTVAYLLQSSDDQRRNAKRTKVNINTIAEKWDVSFYIPESSHRMPSREFVDILYSAGLQEWLLPESDFSSGPAYGPNRRFLTNTYQGKCCVRALRNLAQKVNFATYRARTAPKFPTPLALPSPSSSGLPIIASASTLPGPSNDPGRYVLSPASTVQASAGPSEPRSPSFNFPRGNEAVSFVDAVRQACLEDREGDSLAGSADAIEALRDVAIAPTLSGAARSTVRHGRTPGFFELREIDHGSRSGPAYDRGGTDVSRDDTYARDIEETVGNTLLPLLQDADLHDGGLEWSSAHGSPTLLSVTIDRLHIGAIPGDAETATAAAKNNRR